MTTRIWSMAFAALLLFQLTASAGRVFLDDFEDGSETDGSPVTWTTISNWPFTTHEVEAGNLRVGVSVPDQAGVVGVPAVTLSDTSIRVQLRADGRSDQGFGVFVRGDLISNRAHSFEVAADGGLYFGITGETFQRIDSDLRPTQEDVMLQLDAIGNSITAWAWRAGEPMPLTPAFSRLTSQLPSGAPGVYTSSSFVATGTSGTAIYRYVDVSDTPSVPEPPTFVLGSLLVLSAAFLGRSQIRR